jgi:hypothetical protein
LGKNKRPDSSLCSSAHWSDQEDDWETIDTISVGSSDMDDISILSFSPSPKKPGRGVLWMREQVSGILSLCLSCFDANISV